MAKLKAKAKAKSKSKGRLAGKAKTRTPTKMQAQTAEEVEVENKMGGQPPTPRDPQVWNQPRPLPPALQWLRMRSKIPALRGGGQA